MPVPFVQLLAATAGGRQPLAPSGGQIVRAVWRDSRTNETARAGSRRVRAPAALGGSGHQANGSPCRATGVVGPAGLSGRPCGSRPAVFGRLAVEF